MEQWKRVKAGLEHSFLLLVTWGSQKQNKEKIQILKHKWQKRRVWAGKNWTNKKFKTMDIAFKEEEGGWQIVTYITYTAHK